MRKASATISPWSCFTSSIVPATVPPVASRSSTMSTRAPGVIASLCISSVAEPYSRSYSTLTTSAGSLPSLRTGTKPTPRAYAIGAPKMKPRDSMPTTTSTGLPWIFARRPSTALLNESPSLSSVVMSLNRIPGFGKSGMSRMRAPRSLGAMTATGERLAEASQLEPGVVALDAFALHVVEPGRAVDGRVVGAGDGPRVAAIGPARWMKVLRLLEMLGREIALAHGAQLLTEREMRRGRCLGHRPRPAPAHDLVGSERVAAGGAMRDPVTQRRHVRLAVHRQRLDQLDALALLRRRIGGDGLVLERWPPRIGRLRW